MSRQSHKQSNVVPISVADELDELMSSESIKPNIAFLGLGPVTPTETSSIADAPFRLADGESSIPPRLVSRFETSAGRNSGAADAVIKRLDDQAGPTIGAPPADIASPPRSKVDITASDAKDDSSNDDKLSLITALGAAIGQADLSADFVSSTDAVITDEFNRDVISLSAPGGFDEALNASASTTSATSADNEETRPSALPSVQQNKLPGRPTKIHKCTKAQDGHSHLEDVLYGVLRRAGRPEEGPSGNVITQAGSSFLCKETRVHKRNLGTVLRRLVFKQSIEVLDYERSTTRTARRYRVFSYGEILKRRREAGLEWVVRRRGVEFVNPATGEPLFVDPGAVDGPDSSPDAVTAPPDAVTAGESPAFTSGDSDAVRPSAPHAVTAPPLGNEARENPKGSKQEKSKTTSSVDSSLVSEALQKHWQTDHAAVQQLVRSCLAVRPDCTTSEIVHFIEEKGYILAKNVRGFTNPVGFLLSSVPKCFEGETFNRWRERERLAEEHRLEEERRQKEEHRAAFRWMVEHSRKTLNDPKASDLDRRLAEQFLADNPATEDEAQ